ncbi:unnamed protein product [Penicillium glandicola]
MPGCCPWNCLNICRRHRNPPAPSGIDPIELELEAIVPPAPAAFPVPGVPVNDPAAPSSQAGSSSSINAKDFQYGKLEMWGDLRQRWIDDPNEPNCTVGPLDFELKTLTHAKHRSERWTTNFKHWGPRPLVLQGKNDYHEVKISKHSVRPHVKRGSGVNFHHITTAMGVIILRNVNRYDGPWWSQVALAQYDTHFARNVLRHVYLENVVNANTRDFIHGIWAKTQPPYAPGFEISTASVTQVAWSFDSTEYKAILGTELGKGVAAIVLTAFPRGTHRIVRVVVWKKSIMQLRFDIEVVTHKKKGTGQE